MEQLAELFENEDLRPTTKKNYANKTKMLWKIYSGEKSPPPNLDFLTDKSLQQMLKDKYQNKSTLASYLTAIVAITKRMADTNEKAKEIYEELAPPTTKRWKDIKEKDGDNKLDEKHKKGFMPWNEMMEKIDYSKLTPQQKLIVMLYTEIPPRRLEYRLLINGKGDDTQNYYYQGKLFINDYKTAKLSGSDVIELPKSLVEEFDKYIKSWAVDEGEFIFNNITSTTFGSKVSEAFKKATGVKINNTNLRRMYATKSNKEDLTYNERKDVAKKMGTSITKLDSTYNKSASLKDVETQVPLNIGDYTTISV